MIFFSMKEIVSYREKFKHTWIILAQVTTQEREESNPYASMNQKFIKISLNEPQSEGGAKSHHWQCAPPGEDHGDLSACYSSCGQVRMNTGERDGYRWLWLHRGFLLLHTSRAEEKKLSEDQFMADFTGARVCFYFFEPKSERKVTN